MFTNLIESSSHTREFKRRGSFLLFTTFTYAVLFVIAGVGSIYAYDARLENQNTEFITMLNPVELESVKPEPVRPSSAPPRNNGGRQMIPERAIAMSQVDDLRVTPEKVSVTPNKNLPLPPGPVKFTGRDFEPGGGGPGEPGVSGGTKTVTIPPTIEVGEPPKPPVEKPKPTIIRKAVINSEAISLPKPQYPAIARQIRLQGTVAVQVLINEEGRVVSAKALSGNPMLIPAAQGAAMQARFSPTYLGEQRMKVSGVITYNFVLQ